MAIRVAFFTLGCKLNQLETESIADAFARAGSPVQAFNSEALQGDGAPPSHADLVVINTCTVTGKADRKARRIIRLALSSHPRAAVLVTGCYAQVAAGSLAALDERLLVLPGQSKELLLALPEWIVHQAEGAELPQLLRSWLGSAAPGAVIPLASRFAFNPASFSFHSRPSLKVQDGCDNSCSYCLVHVARGPSTSLAASELLARARALEAAGKRELVLTGVNISQYRDGTIDFSALLKLLVSGTSRIAFRISSYEPDRVDEAFLEAFALDRVRPHVHLAVQSLSKPLLQAMGRGYCPSRVVEAVASLRRARRDPFIAADFISGFPGETEAEAASSLDLARLCDFASIHSFRFSPRPGTSAATLAGTVSESQAGLRAQALAELGLEGKTAYIQRWTGARLGAVVERGGGATTENYLKPQVLGLPADTRPGQAIYCSIEGFSRTHAENKPEGIARFIEYA